MNKVVESHKKERKELVEWRRLERQEKEEEEQYFLGYRQQHKTKSSVSQVRHDMCENIERVKRELDGHVARLNERINSVYTEFSSQTRREEKHKQEDNSEDSGPTTSTNTLDIDTSEVEGVMWAVSRLVTSVFLCSI